MSIASIFPDAAAMEQVLAMGMEEGLTQAVGQIDAILAEDALGEAARHRTWRWSRFRRGLLHPVPHHEQPRPSLPQAVAGRHHHRRGNGVPPDQVYVVWGKPCRKALWPDSAVLGSRTTSAVRAI